MKTVIYLLQAFQKQDWEPQNINEEQTKRQRLGNKIFCKRKRDQEMKQEGQDRKEVKKIQMYFVHVMNVIMHYKHTNKI